MDAFLLSPHAIESALALPGFSMIAETASTGLLVSIYKPIIVILTILINLDLLEAQKTRTDINLMTATVKITTRARARAI